jgi:hypothetical protein
MRAIRNSGLLSFILVRMVRSSALHQVTQTKKLNNKLKAVILSLSETESESFTIPIYGNPLNPARGCIKTVVTSAVVTENMRVSRRWKDESVAYGICK